jgi:hypothetical protein
MEDLIDSSWFVEIGLFGVNLPPLGSSPSIHRITRHLVWVPAAVDTDR